MQKKMEGRGTGLLLAVLLAVLALGATLTLGTREHTRHAEWQRSPSYHLRVLRRAALSDDTHGSTREETCVVLAARYGQPHRGLTDAHHVLLFTYCQLK